MPSRQAGFGAIDQVYALLRGGALLVGVAYVFLGKPGAGAGDEVPIALAAFATYGALLYVAGLGWLKDPARKGRFYTVLGACDLAFVIVLMHLTGGETSPFYRALYIWVAMPAFYFGFRTGTIASAVAFVVFDWIFDSHTLDAWEFLMKAGGLLLHGPVIGFLVERDRGLQRKIAALSETAAGPGDSGPASTA